AVGGSGVLAGVVLAPAWGPALPRGARRRTRRLRVPRARPALLDRRAHDGGLHRPVGGARARAGRHGRARAPPPAARPAARALAPSPGVGDAVGGDREALRVALPSRSRARQRAARRSRVELAW